MLALMLCKYLNIIPGLRVHGVIYLSVTVLEMSLKEVSIHSTLTHGHTHRYAHTPLQACTLSQVQAHQGKGYIFGSQRNFGAMDVAENKQRQSLFILCYVHCSKVSLTSIDPM